MKIRIMALLAFLLLFTFVLTGCLPGEETSEEIDPPPESEAVEGEVDQVDKSDGSADEGETDADKENKETVATQLFLIDKDGMVAPQVLDLPLPDSKEVAAQALEYLVKDGPVSNLLPNGFQAVLPAGTDIIDLNLQEDGMMTVNVSKEIEGYEPSSELDVLQAMTYTLTQFSGVDRVQLWIEGEPQEEMPVNNTPIQNGYTRANGINIRSSESGDLINQEAVTVYYPSIQNDNQYFVPVTQHIDTNDDDDFESLVNAIVEGPAYNNNLMHVFNMETSLAAKPQLKDGVLKVKFDQNVLKDKEAGIISDDVMESLARTLTEHNAVDSVSVEVKGVDQVVNESGDAYKEPVTSNTFVPKQKL